MCLAMHARKEHGCSGESYGGDLQFVLRLRCQAKTGRKLGVGSEASSVGSPAASVMPIAVQRMNPKGPTRIEFKIIWPRKAMTIARMEMANG